MRGTRGGPSASGISGPVRDRPGWVAGIVLFGIGFALPVAAQERAQEAVEVESRFAIAVELRMDSVVTAWLADHDVVGLQVAVGTGDGRLWTGGYGMADLEHRAPVTPHTRFRTASIDKWMTATAAMRLQELGELDLDAPVQEYCSFYPKKRWTLATRHLLGHRGGVRHYWGANDEAPRTVEARAALFERQREERWRMSARHTTVLTPLDGFEDDSLLFEPGTDYQYSSHGFRLVGCVLRGAAGKPYRDLMRELIFEPAGMTHTRDDDAFAIIPERARGYVRRGGELRRSRFRDVSENLPAGGHVSTARDLVRFAIAWDRGELVSEETRARMTAPEPVEEGDESYYGYGVNVMVAPEELPGPVLTHSGGQDGTRTLLVLLPRADLAIAVMSNDEDLPNAIGMLRGLFEIATGG